MQNAYILAEQAHGLFDTMRRLGIVLSGRTGGYMTVRTIQDRPINVPLITVQIGDLTTEKVLKYHAYANEKAERLARTSLQGHVSSFQSRDEDLEQWGGSIKAGELILSFSGLPEFADEAFMLAVAVSVGILERSKAREIAQISGSLDIYLQIAEAAHLNP